MQYLSLQEPRITDFEPKIGPISGGTRITVRGHHMDAGTTITASVVGLPCNVTRYKASFTLEGTVHTEAITKAKISENSLATAREGNVFRGVCHSVNRKGGSVPTSPRRQTPPTDI